MTEEVSEGEEPPRGEDQAWAVTRGYAITGRAPSDLQTGSRIPHQNQQAPGHGGSSSSPPKTSGQ